MCAPPRQRTVERNERWAIFCLIELSKFESNRFRNKVSELRCAMVAAEAAAVHASTVAQFKWSIFHIVLRFYLWFSDEIWLLWCFLLPRLLLSLLFSIIIYEQLRRQQLNNKSLNFLIRIFVDLICRAIHLRYFAAFWAYCDWLNILWNIKSYIMWFNT